jgi:hypothetical protein
MFLFSLLKRFLPTTTLQNPIPAQNGAMSDHDRITALIKIASDPAELQKAQRIAAAKLLRMDGEIFPHDSCAITQSCLLQAAGIAVPNTFQALAFGKMLEKRGWTRVAVGHQRAGDVGSTCVDLPRHGSDHVYLCVKAINSDEMLIADNQAGTPHVRYASGHGGKTPTTHFLRAPSIPPKESANG